MCPLYSSSSDLKELEHTNSARLEVLWAGVFTFGLISKTHEGIPKRANCQAASVPARPPPTIATLFFIYLVSSVVSAIQATEATFSSSFVLKTLTPDADLDCRDISLTEHLIL